MKESNAKSNNEFIEDNFNAEKHNFCNKCGKIFELENGVIMKTCESCRTKNLEYNKKFFDKYKGFYIYLIFNEYGELLYVGESTNYYRRISNHIRGYSTFSPNGLFDFFDLFKIGKIEMFVFNDIAETKEELKFLEKYFIKRCKPIFNSNGRKDANITEERKEILLAYLDSDLVPKQKINLDKWKQEYLNLIKEMNKEKEHPARVF